MNPQQPNNNNNLNQPPNFNLFNLNQSTPSANNNNNSINIQNNNGVSNAPTSLESLMKSNLLNPYQYGEFPLAGKHPYSGRESPGEYCITRSAINGAMGGAMGLAWGVFSVSMGTGVNSYALSPGMPGYIDPTNMSVKEQFRRTGKEMWNSSKSSAKNFGLIGALYTFIECNIEKKRGTHDIYNPLLAGCVTGGLLGFKGGPQAAAFGCVGFAAFGYVIDKLLTNM